MKAGKTRALVLCVAAGLVVAVPGVRADSGDDQGLQEKVKQLEQRVAELEGRSTQEVAVAKTDIPQKTLDFLGQTEISGFVSASYLYNFSKSSVAGASPAVAGRGFDGNNNSFTLNKFKIALERPIDANPTNWAAGYRADLIFGQDAGLIQSLNAGGPGTFNLGSNGDLEQAFIDFNIPIGNGLLVKFGKMVTLMGVDVIEEVNNPNWSVGNQFLYVENFTQTGVMLTYQWNHRIDTELAAFDGWDQLPDNNSSKSFMGRLGLTLSDNTSVGLLGYGGPEQTGNNHDYRTGGEIILNQKFNSKLNSWVQLDYGHETGVDANGKSAEWVGGGVWLTYDFTDKVGVALRGDYVKDKDGVRANPSYIGFTVAPKELTSVTLTLNVKPVESLQIRPEVRWDHSSADTALNGHDDNLTAGLGVAYLY
jgi:Putative beta-barrel porin-2, OmpL-like. bbp2